MGIQNAYLAYFYFLPRKNFLPAQKLYFCFFTTSEHKPTFVNTFHYSSILRAI